MPQFAPSAEERLLKAFEHASKSQVFPTSASSIDQYNDSFNQSLERQYQCRPLLMRINQWIYQRRLCTIQQQLKNASGSDIPTIAALTEKVARLQFASYFGRPANELERAWCHLQIQDRRIPEIDAPFLVWSGTINFKRRAIIYGHWDWVAGIFMMIPIMYAIAGTLLACLTPFDSLIWKVAFVSGMTATTCFAFGIYKSLSFDVFKVGRRYFKPRGLRYFIKA